MPVTREREVKICPEASRVLRGVEQTCCLSGHHSSQPSLAQQISAKIIPLFILSLSLSPSRPLLSSNLTYRWCGHWSALASLTWRTFILNLYSLVWPGDHSELRYHLAFEPLAGRGGARRNITRILGLSCPATLCWPSTFTERNFNNVSFHSSLHCNGLGWCWPVSIYQFW